MATLGLKMRPLSYAAEVGQVGLGSGTWHH